MSLNHSPKIITEGLVLYWDMYNTQKSWKGAPTTNILPQPTTNGRFTTANSWGTYNVNQYNGGAFFNIGTISQVSGNIVTTATNHPLRTFDVITPQTTGGGVVVGTNYFVQKLSNTTFQLHAHNNNQTGSEGYIQSTGYHKVHDQIALNQQIPISLSQFPNMWYGPAHQPNSHLVKEIVAGAGPTGQNVMRLHIPGNTGQADGMAYGVNPPVTLGQTVNVSYLVRCSRPDKSLNYQTWFGTGMSIFNTTYLVPTEWTRIEHQWVASATTSFTQYFFPSSTVDSRYWIDICDLQVETNTIGGPQPFVAGTRQASQAVLDLVSTDSIQIVGQNFSFEDRSLIIQDSNSQYLQLSNPIKMRMGIQNFQICAWVRQLDNAHNSILEARGLDLIGYLLVLNYNAPGKISLFLNHSQSAQQIYISTNQSLPFGVVQYICCQVDRATSTIKFYLNGVLFDTITGIHNSSIQPVSGDVYRIGYDHGGSTTNMEFFAYQHYNRALQDVEILQNFNSQKQRFNL